VLRKGRFSDLVRRQLDLFEADQSSLLADAAAADAAWSRADRDESESRFGDYVLEMDVVGERLYDVREAYARCDIVFVPSRRESFCRVAAEAMLNGIPVVASDLQPLQELLGDDEAGLLVPIDDRDAAVAALRRLASDEDLRRRLGAEGRRRAAAFSPEAVARAMRALYETVVPGAYH
jgi:glycosyltransferase involved in cell wall biosynthesis